MLKYAFLSSFSKKQFQVLYREIIITKYELLGLLVYELIDKSQEEQFCK